MDTILILKDTITAYVVKVVDSCKPCIQESETSCNDMIIAGIICGAIVTIAAIIAYTVQKWQKEALAAKRVLEEVKIDVEKRKKDIDIDRQTQEWKLKKQKEEESIESDFVDFCQSENSIKDKLVDICVEHYKSIMKKRMSINSNNNSNDEDK